MNKQQAQPEKVVLTPAQATSLQARVKAATGILSADDIKILTGLINFSLWLQNHTAWRN